ncbi:universal stress protein [Kitasatospora paranensis]|uniref:Universal stress protein n=1 Tax=Kitasatospora paranensis TaxID=258053 RepID=A0ABW2FS85_9ACTN
MAASLPAERRIVVGVDGSASSVCALRWAAGQAAATGAVVEAVICWGFPWVHGLTPASVDRELGSVARQMLADAVADAAGGRCHQVIRQIVESGDPSEILPRRARGADLLVVGNRGRSGVAATLLGSVSRHCTEHAPCTVVVVRAPTA